MINRAMAITVITMATMMFLACGRTGVSDLIAPPTPAPTSEYGWLIVDETPHNAWAFVFVDTPPDTLAPKLEVVCRTENGQRYLHVDINLSIPGDTVTDESVTVIYTVDNAAPVRAKWQAEHVLDEMHALKPTADHGNAIIDGILGGAQFIHIKIARESHSFDVSRWKVDAEPSFRTCIRLHEAYIASQQKAK